jgi:hypothetical protein
VERLKGKVVLNRAALCCRGRLLNNMLHSKTLVSTYMSSLSRQARLYISFVLLRDDELSQTSIEQIGVGRQRPFHPVLREQAQRASERLLAVGTVHHMLCDACAHKPSSAVSLSARCQLTHLVGLAV